MLQTKSGCELEKCNGSVKSPRAFDEYGFDGEGFIAFDYDPVQWIDDNPKAKETKIKWAQQTGRNELLCYYLNTCTDWISTFNNTKKSKFDLITLMSCNSF